MTETLETNQLYTQDDHLLQFEAQVVAVDLEARTVVLDQTAFYPTGGHQHCDQGRIGKDRRNFVIVTDVKCDEHGVVVHTWTGGEGELKVGDKVQGSIHEERRHHHMRLHSAQHALSRLATDRFGSVTGRADFSPQGGLAVLEPALDWKEALLLEDDVNRLIRNARSVSRREDDEGRIQIKIAGLDESPCAGTHVKSTAEIGLFKITSMDGKVVRYEVGPAAQRYALRGSSLAQEVARRLGVDSLRDLVPALDELIEERDQARDRLAHWKAETTTRSVTTARRTIARRDDGVVVLRVDLTHLTPTDAREFLKDTLAEPGEVWVALAERGNLMISSGSDLVDAQAVMSLLTESWGIKGGGNPRFAQGGPVPHDIGAPLGHVVEQILQHTASVPS